MARLQWIFSDVVAFSSTFFRFQFRFRFRRMEVGLELKAEMEAGVAGPTCCLACVRSRVVIADAVVWQHLFWGRLSMVDAPLH